MPLSDILGATHLTNPGNERGRYEPQRGNNAIIRFNNVPGNSDSQRGDAGPLELSLQTLPAPKSSHNVVEHHWFNEVRKYAGKRTYDDLTVEYRNFVSPDIAAILQRWYGQCQGVGGEDVAADLLPNGAIGYASDYKKNGESVLFGPDGTRQRVFEVLGAWISQADFGDFDMSNDDLVNVSVTITIDKYRYLGEQ